MTRDIALQSLIDATRQALASRLAIGSPAADVAARIFSLLAHHRATGDRPQPNRLPVCGNLEAALATAERAGDDIATVVAAFREVEPLLCWRPRAGAEKAGEVFAKGHANALIVGPGGFEDRPDIWFGASLIAPQVQYIDHHHPPAEVYLVLSPGSWRQEDRPWHEPGIGGTVFNTPDIVHAMKAGDAPLLALWCLLVDDS